MVIIGWAMRGVILAAKLDECGRCQFVGPHLVVRKTYWGTFFWLPVLLVGVRHGLLCSECGDWTSLSFLAVRRAWRSGRLTILRPRPTLAGSAAPPGGASQEDWRILGLAPDASPSEVQAAYRRQAKAIHPDVGGSDAAFGRLSAAYARVAREPQGSAAALDVEEAVAPIVVNPNRGFFDGYLKVWSAAAVLALAVGVTASFIDAPSASANPTTQSDRATEDGRAQRNEPATIPGPRAIPGSAASCPAGTSASRYYEWDDGSLMCESRSNGTSYHFNRVLRQWEPTLALPATYP